LKTLVFIFFLGILGCSRADPDAVMRKQLTGNWIFVAQYEDGYSMTSTMSIGPDGQYVGRIVWQSSYGTNRITELGGTWQIRDGTLVDTMRENSAEGAPLPMVSRARVIRLDGKELHLEYEREGRVTYPTNDVVFRRRER
jgi:hypothetical protein